MLKGNVVFIDNGFFVKEENGNLIPVRLPAPGGGRRSGGGSKPDVLTVPLKPTQIYPLAMGDPDDWAADFTINSLMTNVNGRSMTATFGFINNTNNSITATLWNTLSNAAFVGAAVQNIVPGGTEQSVSITVNPNTIYAGQTLGIRFTAPIGTTGSYEIMSGGLGIADMIVAPVIQATTLFPIIVANATPSNGLSYVTKSSVACLRGLSSEVFSGNIISFNQGTLGTQEVTNNFGVVPFTNANADVPPTLVTATQIKSDVGVRIATYTASPITGRIVFLFSNEQFVAGI